MPILDLVIKSYKEIINYTSNASKVVNNNKKGNFILFWLRVILQIFKKKYSKMIHDINIYLLFRKLSS